MKTLRELLLARHRAAGPGLDLARQRAVAGLGGSARGRTAGCRAVAAWLGLFRIPRVAWGGLAGVWLLILGLNLATREPAATSAVSRVERQRSPETLQALREQKRLFAELVGALPETDADVPRFVPRPRSEWRTESRFA